MPSNRSMASLKEGFNHINETQKTNQGFIGSRIKLINMKEVIIKDEPNLSNSTLINKNEIKHKVNMIKFEAKKQNVDESISSIESEEKAISLPSQYPK